MDFLFLSKTLLFHGTTPQEIESMLSCLHAEQRGYQKSDVIYHAGNRVTSLGMVLSGSVSVESDDFWGNKSILDRVGPGQVFAETYACVPGEAMMVSVVASEPTTVLFLDTGRLVQVCSNACEYHGKLIRNLLFISAQKNLNLSRRIFYTSSKSIRGRIVSYLSDQVIRRGNREFTIPFNRQQLADYLSVDRSALSNELSKMNREGLIRVDRNHFLLLKMEETF